MKISKKLIFLAIILIVVSIISMYFGSITTVEGATPAAATCTGIVCASKVTDCKSKKLYSNQTCCASQANKKTACKP